MMDHDFMGSGCDEVIGKIDQNLRFVKFLGSRCDKVIIFVRKLWSKFELC